MFKCQLSQDEVRCLVGKICAGDLKPYQKLESAYLSTLKKIGKKFASRNSTEGYDDCDGLQIARKGFFEACTQYRDHFKIILKNKDLRCVKSNLIKIEMLYTRRQVEFSRFFYMYILKNTNLEIRKLKRRMINGHRIEVQTLADYKVDLIENSLSDNDVIKIIANVKKEIQTDELKLKMLDMVLKTRGANAICRSLKITQNQYNRIYTDLIDLFKLKLAEIYN